MFLCQRDKKKMSATFKMQRIFLKFSRKKIYFILQLAITRFTTSITVGCGVIKNWLKLVYPDVLALHLSKKKKKLSSANFFFNAFTLTPNLLSWRRRYWGLSLTDVLWHELSSAEMRTAEGFDSVHSKYPAPSGADQNRRLSQHC